MNSCTSGWLVLTRNFVAGSHPQNDKSSSGLIGTQAKPQERRVKKLEEKEGRRQTPEDGTKGQG
jgi:hypothetical protein